MSKLVDIQKKLKAPKGQFNKFGKYYYRSCEDILEAVKPILADAGCTLTLSDEVVLIGDRYYVKAIAWLKGEDVDEVVTAYAREADNKAGMDSSQITGTASSYARKYALNGLFCIDDTKDADSDEYANQNGTAKKPATSAPANGDKEKEVFDPSHPLWQKALDKMVAGKGSIKELQKVYIIPAAAEKAITDYLNAHINQN
jgi:hypothetical protein